MDYSSMIYKASKAPWYKRIFAQKKTTAANSRPTQKYTFYDTEYITNHTKWLSHVEGE